jgi:uncharacterized YigZ family protein
MLKRYRTPAAFAEAELVEKRSRFIAAVMPVNTEAEALDFLRARRELYPDARHHVYAYLVETEDGVFSRYSDDGEPQGTGGMPVFDVLRKRELTNAALVVTRYFGGTLLGAAGLVRAYSGSAAAAVDNAGEAEMFYCRRLEARVSYGDSGKVRSRLETLAAADNDRALRLELEPPEYTHEVLFRIWVPADDLDRLKAELIDITASRVAFADGEFEYRALRR